MGWCSKYPLLLLKMNYLSSPTSFVRTLIICYVECVVTVLAAVCAACARWRATRTSQSQMVSQDL